jgi:uncharacterized glyoxalase superfamily protein PhnB
MADYKPKDYTSVSPYFVVDDANRFIDLLKNVFDGRLLRQYHRPDGSLMHAEMLLDDTVIMLGEATEQHPPNRLLIHVYVEDVDAVFDKAMSAGCELIEKPKVKENDTDKRGGFRDFAGNTWYVSTQTDRS